MMSIDHPIPIHRWFLYHHNHRLRHMEIQSPRFHQNYSGWHCIQASDRKISSSLNPWHFILTPLVHPPHSFVQSSSEGTKSDNCTYIVEIPTDLQSIVAPFRTHLLIDPSQSCTLTWPELRRPFPSVHGAPIAMVDPVTLIKTNAMTWLIRCIFTINILDSLPWSILKFEHSNLSSWILSTTISGIVISCTYWSQDFHHDSWSFSILTCHQRLLNCLRNSRHIFNLYHSMKCLILFILMLPECVVLIFHSLLLPSYKLVSALALFPLLYYCIWLFCSFLLNQYPSISFVYSSRRVL